METTESSIRQRELETRIVLSIVLVIYVAAFLFAACDCALIAI